MAYNILFPVQIVTNGDMSSNVESRIIKDVVLPSLSQSELESVDVEALFAEET